ncbi:pyruvate kinase [Pasteurella multocida]|uniref:pyruvate kinase n=1 Tax=Pasteurella multocida TaxID=747 RepID=UPI000E010CEE|nr:pyruvate kinase [Pasteurella multocida]SUB46811.1 pyruvate kinase [Pasteurella multocida subsp. septica]
MKKFDLEKALAGEPVVLRNGSKAFVKFVLENPVCEECAMIGYVIDDRGRDSLIGWYKNGLYASCGGDGLDIVGMYEEPRPTVTLTLPCPLKSVTVGQRVFYLDLNKQCERICAFLFQKDSTYHFNLLKNGGIFSTEEDAQAWLDAMKNARR